MQEFSYKDNIMWLELLKSALDDNFGDKLEATISTLGLTIKEFAQESGIPESTLYKAISQRKDLRVSTLKQIVEAVRKREELNHDFIIAIITTREALDRIGRKLKINNEEIRIREYPATTIEEEVIRGIIAEKEGVKGIICGPIAATTLEKVVDIPVVALHFEEKILLDALNRMMKKL